MNEGVCMEFLWIEWNFFQCEWRNKNFFEWWMNEKNAYEWWPKTKMFCTWHIIYLKEKWELVMWQGGTNNHFDETGTKDETWGSIDSDKWKRFQISH